jgi:hypothetical protein
MRDDSAIPVTLDFLGCTPKIFCKTTKKYIGIIGSDVAKILRQFVAELFLTLTANLSLGGTSEPKGDRETHRLHIILYGRNQVGDQVGELLADKGLYL